MGPDRQIPAEHCPLEHNTGICIAFTKSVTNTMPAVHTHTHTHRRTTVSPDMRQTFKIYKKTVLDVTTEC